MFVRLVKESQPTPSILNSGIDRHVRIGVAVVNPVMALQELSSSGTEITVSGVRRNKKSHPG